MFHFTTTIKYERAIVNNVSPPVRHIRELEHAMTGTAATTPQIKNLIGRVRKNKRAARAACT